MNLSDHVVVMHQGQKLAEGPPQQVRSDPLVQSAYFGEANPVGSRVGEANPADSRVGEANPAASHVGAATHA